MISIPFSGSKRYSYKHVKKISEVGNYETVFEPFGGSCVLSVNLYNDDLIDKAIVNDYDRFFDLYPEFLDLKDKVVEEGYKRGLKRTSHNSSIGDYRIENDGSKTKLESRVLNAEDKKILQDIITEFVPEKLWRYFAVGGNFAFSAVCSHDKVNLKDFCLFNANLKTDKQRKYLEVFNQLEVEHLDWKEFFNKHEKSIRDSESLLILDPPYVGTRQGQYKGQFTKADTKELIDKAISLNTDFIFFNHNEEQVKNWLEGLDFSIQLTGNNISTANRNRFDVMAFVKNDL